MKIYKTFVRPHLEYAIQAWSPQQEGDIQILERVQRRALKCIQGFNSISYIERLRRTGIFPLVSRRERGDLIETFKILKGIDKINTRDFYTFESEVRPGQHRVLRGDHDLNLYRRTYQTGQRNKSFSFRVIECWNSLPATVKDANSIGAFKRGLDKHRFALPQCIERAFTSIS